MESTVCPSCGSSTIVDGQVMAVDRADSQFVPRGISQSIWGFRGVGFPHTFLCCTTCGFLWTRVRPEQLRELIRDHGGELGRQRLASLEAGIYHGVPNIPEARAAAEKVAELDALMFAGRQPEATRRYRDLTSTTWDQAIHTLRFWADLPRAKKLALFGWVPEDVPSKGDPEASDHPMRDRVLDG